MYGKDITLIHDDGMLVRVWVNGVPSMTAQEWQDKAIKILVARLATAGIAQAA